MIYTKPALSIADQIALLKSRGLKIGDISKATYYLENINYYRLSAYLLTFQKYNNPTHSFMPWATFEKVIRLYVFDRELRFLCIDAIERIEVSLRSRIAYEYSIRYGNNWYENPALYINNKIFLNTKKKISEELGRSKEIFIQHYNSKYSQPANPPSWMTIEVLSFGQLSILFKNLKTNDAKKAISDHFGVSGTILESWIENLAYIRNLCAHHSRLWNRTLTISPTIPKAIKNTWLSIAPSKHDKIYTSLCVLGYLLETASKSSPFVGKLKALCHRFPDVNLNSAGFPAKWESDLFWNKMFMSVTHKARIYIFNCLRIFKIQI